jgi:predicted ester cyclase
MNKTAAVTGATSETNKALVREIVRALNDLKGDATKLPSLFAKYYLPDYIHHDPSRGDMAGDQRIKYVSAMVTAFPDLTYTEDGMLAEGGFVASRYTMRVTHTGIFMGVAPTGRQIVAKGADIRRIEGGKIAEIWDFPDTFGLMTQLGLVSKR